MNKIIDISKKLGIKENDLMLYGDYMAKIKLNNVEPYSSSKLVLVTAITPTKAGEGKTTTTIGLVDGLNKINKKATGVLREPSLGPVFGLKGGACGGGKSSLFPDEDINLHFTGDMHALTSSINLISAIIDNHIYQGNELNINPNKIIWKRAIDMNDRELRNVTIGIGDKNGIERLDHFEITVASELMAILCLSNNEDDFVNRVNNIIVAYNFNDEPVYLKEFKITKSILKLMKYALYPNLVQTLEGNPVIIHGGPFANIAHGCNSIIATKLGLSIPNNIVVTEAGFASDLGAEKFFDIKCRTANIKPDCVVLVATIKALKLHGGIDIDNINTENIEAIKIGFENLKKHISIIRKFSLPFVVAINHFNSDTENEINTLKSLCKEFNFPYAFSDGYTKGGEGSVELANKVVEILDTKKSNFTYLYDDKLSIKDKISKICCEIYGAKNVNYLEDAVKKISLIEEKGITYPICIAKTPLSLSDDPKLINVPKDFDVTVKDVELKNGAKYIIVYLGNILTMPGLPKIPNAVEK